jgi:hypothetical protein
VSHQIKLGPHFEWGDVESGFASSFSRRGLRPRLQAENLCFHLLSLYLIPPSVSRWEKKKCQMFSLFDFPFQMYLIFRFNLFETLLHWAQAGFPGVLPPGVKKINPQLSQVTEQVTFFLTYLNFLSKTNSLGYICAFLLCGVD